MLSESEKIDPYWLALWHTPGISPLRFFQLLEVFSNSQTVLETAFDDLIAQGFSEETVHALKKPNWSMVEKDLQWAQKKNNHVLIYTDDRYPPLLKQLVAPPPTLFVQGDINLLQSLQLAMVGSRQPTPTGIDIAYVFARDLARIGLTITSGLATGIDAVSHRGALSVQGKTIAVLGNGIDLVYPKTHFALSEQIAQEGALVSAYPLGTPPKATHFPQRNHLVGGLSLGVLVVEASLRSGSLITARLAGEAGRDVFAIPGSIYNPLSYGCHFLIRQGAKLVETIHDILEELNLSSIAIPTDLSSSKKIETNHLDQASRLLYDAIGFEKTTVDQLVTRTGFSPQKITFLAFSLEKNGFIANISGEYQRV